MKRTLRARKYECRCGGTLLIDVAANRTLHSLPTCPEYDAICKDATFEGIGFDVTPVQADPLGEHLARVVSARKRSKTN